jgi:16S rRNA processing protein RimM
MVVPFAEASLPRYQALRRVFIRLPAEAGGEVVDREVAGARRFKDAILIRFAGCETSEAARSLVGGVIQVPESEVPPLPEGQFYHFELLGLKVFTVEGAYLGEVTEIFPTGSNDVYVVRDGPRETLIPAIRDVVREIDLPGQRMVIDPLPGLLGDVAG